MKIFKKNEISIIEAEHKSELYTFVKADKLYIVLTEINEGGKGVCTECESTNTKQLLIGRNSKTYATRYCDSCKMTSVREYKIKFQKIPVNLLQLIDIDWSLSKGGNDESNRTNKVNMDKI